MEALVFVRFIFNVPILDHALSSRRCKGVVVSGKKATVERDEPLTIRDLQRLRALLEDVGEPLWERMLAGSALCCLYARSRWSDWQQAATGAVDETDKVTFLEYKVEVFKTVNARYFSGDPLFLAAMSPGVTSSNWARVWMDVGAELGLVSMVPPCPAPDGNGKATRRPVDTDEVGAWLRTILGRKGEKIGAHSLKTTLLSYATKRGFSDSDLLRLGSHANGARMAMIYGRDMLARPLRLLQALLKEIREGKFDPNATRSGRLVGVDIEEFDPLPARISDAAELPECEQDREVQGPSRQAPGDSDDAASYAPVATPLPKEDQPFDPDIEKQMALEAMGCKTESDSGSSESSAGLDESGRRAKLLGVPKPMAGTKFLQHTKSRMLHMMRDCDVKLLLCGRAASDDYKPPGVIRYDSSVCRNCGRAVQAQPA